MRGGMCISHIPCIPIHLFINDNIYPFFLGNHSMLGFTRCVFSKPLASAKMNHTNVHFNNTIFWAKEKPASEFLCKV